jgi:hypothetical protein
LADDLALADVLVGERAQLSILIIF